MRSLGEQLSRAIQSSATGPAQDCERLYDAGLQLWTAYVTAGAHWPQSAERAAAALLTELLSAGTMRRTFESMTQEQLEQVREKLRHFCTHHLPHCPTPPPPRLTGYSAD